MEARAFHSSVSPKGQITLPLEIRRELGIEPKDTVEITLRDGTVQVRPAVSRIRKHYGAAGPLKEPLGWKDVERIAAEDAALNAASEDAPD